MTITKKQLIIIALALFPCIVWGLLTFICTTLKNHLSYLPFLSDYPVYRIMYLLRALIFLPLLMMIYKEFLPSFNHSHQKFYIRCSILATICLLIGLFIQNKFWNYILDGCLVSPLVEELIVHFILYEARNRGFKVYVLISMLSSLSFGLMHFGYYTFLINKLVILPRLGEYFVCGLTLCGIFWFFPRLSLLIIAHSLGNLYYVLSIASELGFKFNWHI